MLRKAVQWMLSKAGKAVQQKDKATQHNLPKAVFSSRKNWQLQVELKPTTLALYAVFSPIKQVCYCNRRKCPD